MPDWIVISFILLVFSPFIGMAVSLLEQAWWGFKEKMKWGIECECRTPKDYSPLGSTFVCDDCARKWYSTHDNIAWAGWSFAPWWKRTQMKMRLEFPGRRKVEDPVVVLTVEPACGIVKYKDKLRKVREELANRIGTGGS